MIKINLAKTQNYSAGGKAEGGGAAITTGGGPHPAIKGVVLVIFVALVYGYESYTLAEKGLVLSGLRAEFQKSEQEVSQFGSITNAVNSLTKEKAKLDEILKVIEKISQKRAYKLGAIATVQEHILDDLWLEELVVDKEKVSLRGVSRSSSSVQVLVSKLKESPGIKTASNKGLKRRNTGTDNLNEFEIVARIDN